MNTNTAVAPCCHLPIKRHTALTQVTPSVAHSTGVTHLGGTLARSSHTEICFSLYKSPLKKNQTIIRSEKKHLLPAVQRLAEAGLFLTPHSRVQACPSMVTRTPQDGVMMARMLPGAFFAAERWKGSVRTPTGGGAALGTQLVISVPEAPADWDANSSRPTQLPVC